VLAGEDEITRLEGIGKLSQERLETHVEHDLAVYPALALPD